MNKKILIVIVIVIVIVAALWWWQSPSVQAPMYGPETGQAPAGGTMAAEGDTTSAIDKDLGAIDTGTLDAEFKTIDSDLNGL